MSKLIVVSTDEHYTYFREDQFSHISWEVTHSQSKRGLVMGLALVVALNNNNTFILCRNEISSESKKTIFELDYFYRPIEPAPSNCGNPLLFHLEKAAEDLILKALPGFMEAALDINLSLDIPYKRHSYTVEEMKSILGREANNV